MWRSRLSTLWDRALSRRLVGRDNQGNNFYLQAPQAPGDASRRIAEHKDGAPDANLMDVEWWAWLHHRRDEDDLPSAAELARAAQARAELAERVRIIDAEDAKDRLRGLGKVAGKGKTSAERKRAALLQLGSAHVDAGLSDRPRRKSREDARPEPSGSGDSFVPGSWTP